MNKKPVNYYQTDARWKNVRLPCTGGTMSIGGGGCGPTSAAMLIETLTGKTCLPTETFKWCCENGFVFDGQGTSYYAFRPLFAKYGLSCEMVNIQCLSATSPLRKQMIERLQAGYYLIALMKKGTWTSGGHYIVVWWADNKIRINDPASTKDARVNGDPDTFFKEAKYFWLVDARKYNKGDELDMTKAEFLASLTDDEAREIVEKANRAAGKLKPSSWAVASCEKGIESGLFSDGDNDGLVDNPQAYVKRQELATVMDRAGLVKVD